MPDTLTVALATPRPATSLDEGLEKVRSMLAEAAERGAAIVCFPEAYLPGLRGQGFEVAPFGPADHERVLDSVARWTREHAIAAIIGTERIVAAGRQIAAYVFDETGRLLGCQTKNQIDPSEDGFYVPGEGRSVFDVRGVRFGITICHEGWRYPETVRFAATRGAKIVFHPQLTGSRTPSGMPGGARLTDWGSPAAPYYEKAMACRALENAIYFASVNYALELPESATSIIAPSGACRAFLPYGEEGVLVATLPLDEATGLLAARWAPERNLEEPAEQSGSR
ncbi:MAG TPA: carbon-nitrogen hydrolase family protein [Thermoanaerobaculia bacterium]|nr:carbon-nitrogen hydrolase family protein [Thermoanaerobaculia bacterium]